VADHFSGRISNEHELNKAWETLREKLIKILAQGSKIDSGRAYEPITHRTSIEFPVLKLLRHGTGHKPFSKADAYLALT
jgi:hypothetical protein